MENALLVGLSRQVALGRELDVIANNVANVSTNGFKARASRFADYMSPRARMDAAKAPDKRVNYVIDAGTALDMSQGSIEITRNPLDVAVKGDGFLAVQTPAGERYTRNGALAVDQRGRLVTSDGHAVVGDNGPITIDQSETDLAIAPDGLVSSRQAQHGRIKLVRFEDPASLTNAGGNTFTAAGQPLPAGTTSRLESGAIERSNVSPVLEMTRMIEVNRTYSTVAGMLSRMDELKRSAVSRLADTAQS